MSARNRSLNFQQSSVSVQSLGSGSSGNAFLITAHEQTVLIDCGIGIRKLTTALRDRAVTPADISAICVTHEHSDHIASLSKTVHSEMTLFSTKGTAMRSAIARDQHVRALGETPHRIGNITIWPLPVAHDAKEPCGFLLELPDGVRVTLLTDIGSWHDRLADYILASDVVILEANHDVEMLRRGPYPLYLKKRVASDVGHMSNDQCGEALTIALRGATHAPEIWLAHLSETNNRPDIAESTVRAALARADIEARVTALPRRAPGVIWTPDSVRRPTPALNRVVVPVPAQLGLDLF